MSVTIQKRAYLFSQFKAYFANKEKDEEDI